MTENDLYENFMKASNKAVGFIAAFIQVQLYLNQDEIPALQRGKTWTGWCQKNSFSLSTAETLLKMTKQLAFDLESGIATISRDLDYMRDRMYAPIEYDYAQKGYYYTEPLWWTS